MKNLKTLFALLTISLVLLSCNTNEHIYDDELVDEQFSGKIKTFAKSSDLTINESLVPPPPPPGLEEIITFPIDGSDEFTGIDDPKSLPLRWDEGKITSNNVIIKAYSLHWINPPTLLFSVVTPNDGIFDTSAIYGFGGYRYEIYNSSSILKDSVVFYFTED